MQPTVRYLGVRTKAPVVDEETGELLVEAHDVHMSHLQWPDGREQYVMTDAELVRMARVGFDPHKADVDLAIEAAR